MRDLGLEAGAALKPGLIVRLRNDPNRWGVLEAVIERNGRPAGRVRMATTVSTFPLRELELVPAQAE
jgi:hypothetical protein